VNKDEAKRIADVRLGELRRLTDEELVRRFLGRQETSEVVGKTGTRYQLEIQAVTASRENENLRVMVSVDDGGRRSFAPLTEDFIITPAGSFVGG
jgi:hypothetical protein